jgi:adenylosuccinate lyase|tara:strand:- start:5096 stop:6436 length:1341 start_codon:yes stop_codon:yes gene_type:complete
VNERISPLDGRYASSIADLLPYFSETALMRYRLQIEIEYLIALSNEKSIKELSPISKQKQDGYRKIYLDFNNAGARRIKKIENKTNHDVKAVEYYIREKVDKSLHPWIHFALTSEDINNLSYTLMWKNALENVFSPLIKSLNTELKKLAKQYSTVPMLSMTHGQPATPTTFGKELAVYHARLKRQAIQIKSQSFLGKFGGATGTWSTHYVAYPNVNWMLFAKGFIKSVGLEPNLITTQIEPHDSMSESYHQMVRVNSILIDLSRDFWYYISRGILEQKKIKDEVGSSAMPHKINPIQFENAEGNMGISNAILNHLAIKLPISRMQRDLSDSTVLRNQGVAMGHSVLAIKNILKGLKRIKINKAQLDIELNNHWEVLAEAIQTILRKNGNDSAYEKLKELTRGHNINQKSLESFIMELNISDNEKRRLLSLTPHNYIGLASKITGLI